VTTVDTVRDPASLECPYVGLTSYTQENAPFFFGRDAERRVLISNLRASRLTLLYAQSGAGKSSLLRAGVAAKLVQLAGRSLDQRRPARNIPIVFSSWRDDPTEELIEAVQHTITAFLPQAVRAKSTETLPNVAFDVPRTVSDATLPYRWPTGPSRPTHTRLGETLKVASKAADATLLVMLDQFEEYFLYRSKEAQDGHFADELAACINQADLRVNFLIAIREDAYSGLGNLFKSRIANVYGNYLHLENLTRECARQAIEMPVASFNELHPHAVPVEIEPGLVDVVLDELRPGQFVLDGGGQGRVSGANGDQRYGGEITAPYLQLVMKRLWETELPNSRRLRRETLEALGGAQTIVRTHVDRALGDLPEESREATVDIFHHLVTPSGTKIALAASDLAEYTGRPAEEASVLLERLAESDTRIVRPVPPPPGQEGGIRYEISHDLLAPAILDWGGRQRAVRLEHEKESAEREVRVEKRRARTFRGLALGAAALLVVAILLWVTAINSRHQAESLAIAARAESVLGQDPEMSGRLALRALNVSSTAQAQTALRDALPQMQLKAKLAPAPPLRIAAFSADGTKILTAAADGRIRIFDAATGTQLARFAGFAGVGTLNSAAFSRDGTRIVTANDDGTARILDVSSGKVTGVLTPPGGNGYAVSSAAFSPDGKLIIASYADGTARIWDARSSRQIRALTAEQGHVLLGAAFSPDGKRVVTASSGGNARIYDARTGAQVRVLSGRFGLESAAFSPNGKLVVTACGDGTARIWRVSTGRLVARLTPPSYRYSPYTVFSAAFSPDGRHVVTAGGDGVARIWDAASGRLVRVLGTAGSGSLQAASYSPDGTSIVTASAGGLVRVWVAATGKQAGPVLASAGGTSPLRSAVFSPDGKWAATGGRFGTVTIWKAPAAGSRSSSWTVRNVISIPEGDAVNGMTFSRNGRLLVTANQSGTAYVWQVPSGLPWGEFLAGYGQPLNTVAFDPAHQNWVVTAGGDGYARIFRISDDTQVGARFGVPLYNMNDAAFSPNGKLIVTAGSDGYARVWDAATQQQSGGKFGYGSPMSSATFTGDGTKLVTTEADGYTVIWKCTTTPPTASAFIQTPGNSVPHDAAFSPDGALVVTAGSDGTVREWDATTGNQVLVLGSSSGLISTVAFRGSEVITASSGGTAKIWDAQPAEQRGLLPSGSGQQVYTSTFSPANPRIVATANSNGTVSVWNTSRPAHPMATLQVPGAPNSAEFSADGKLLVTAGNEQVRIWRMSSLGHPVRVLNTKKPCENMQNTAAPYLYSAMFSRDGRLVVTSENDGTACVWNAGTGKLLRRFIEPQGVSGGVAGGNGVASSAMHWAVFSPNGKQVLTANADGTARIWDVKTGRQLRVVSEPTGEAINAAWFSPDGKLLVTASNDGTARIWDATSGRLLHTLRGPGLTPVYNAAFSHDGNQVVSCSGSTAVIWSSAGQQLTEFQGRSLADCEFSPDGRQVVTAGGDGYARIFSTELAGSLTQVKRIAQRRLHLTPQTPAECRLIGVC
jgi:WD40 repeat protein